VRGGESVGTQEAEGQRESLKKFTLDLTERARQGKLDPVIGRDERNPPCHPVLQTPHQGTTPVLIANPAWARPRLSKGWRSASLTAKFRNR